MLGLQMFFMLNTKTEENTRAATTMKEEVDQKKEILDSRRFITKFDKNLLGHGAKNFMQRIYIGYMYSRWRKLKGLNINDPKVNSGQMRSSLKEFWKRNK